MYAPAPVYVDDSYDYGYYRPVYRGYYRPVYRPLRSYNYHH